MENEYIFILETPAINVSQNSKGVEKQIIIGGFLKGGNFSYQKLPPKKLWLNLVITTNPRSETSLCFFVPDDDVESNCCRLIHAVDEALFYSLERKLESSNMKMSYACLTLGEIKSHDSIPASEIYGMVKDGLLIESNELFSAESVSTDGLEKCLSVELDFGYSMPTMIEVELIQVNYQFSSQVIN